MSRRIFSSAKRLQLEQLESRALMAADLAAAAGLLPSNPQGSSDMSGDGFPGEVSVMAAVALGYTTPVVNQVADAAPASVDPATALALVAGAPPATSGVGQMTITTGANTSGIGSFATSVSGFASEWGGRS